MRTSAVEGLQIVHSLPGRVRIHLPGCSGRGPRQVEQLLWRLPGIRSVQASSLTGNVLIHFDAQTITTDDLVDWLTQVEARGPNGPPGNDEGKVAVPLLRAGLRALMGHALVDGLFYAVVFAEPFGLPLAGLGALHLGLDAFVWTAALAPLLTEASLPRALAQHAD